MCRTGGPRCNGRIGGQGQGAASGGVAVADRLDMQGEIVAGTPARGKTVPVEATAGTPSRDAVDRMAQGLAADRRGWDGKPLDDHGRRLYALRESGYTGPIDQDGYAVTGLAAPAEAANSRVVDRDGFVVGTDRAPGGAGGRPSVGGPSARVQDPDGQVSVIVGLDNTSDGGLLLHLVPVEGNATSQAASNRAMAAYKRGEVGARQVPAEGLTALDAYIPGEPASTGRTTS